VLFADRADFGQPALDLLAEDGTCDLDPCVGARRLESAVELVLGVDLDRREVEDRCP
jgi:hypothetical protein